MGKIKNTAMAFGYLLSKPSEAIIKLYRHALENKKKEHTIAKYNLPKGLSSIDFLDLFPDFEEEINTYTFSKGISAITDMSLLKGLARKFENCDFFEIGTQKGESISNVAEVAKNCVSLSLSNDEITAFGWGEKYIAIQRFFSKHKKNVKHIGHNSMTYDFSQLNQKFDLIFIDGDHTYEGVLSDTINAFKLLKDENSIIVWHDYAPGFQDVRWSVLAAIMDGAPADKRKNIYHVSNSICAIYTNQKFNTKNVEFPEVPDKVFSIKVSGKKIQQE